jgi:hypothetical protein
MSNCACLGCITNAKSSCSGCEREQYCSSTCQKLDWKIHKSMCPILKKLLKKLQPFHEAYRIINEILATKKGNDIRVLEHLLSYAEYQFGEKVAGILYRERDGERVSSWNIDLGIYYGINCRIIDFYTSDRSLGTISCSDKMSLYVERALR